MLSVSGAWRDGQDGKAVGVEALVDHGAFVIRIEGAYTLEEFLSTVEGMLAEHPWEGRLPVVLDARAAVPGNLSTHDLQRIIDLFARHDDVVLPRRAHVLPDVGSSRARSKVASIMARAWHDHDVEAFADFDEAVEWATRGADQPGR